MINKSTVPVGSTKVVERALGRSDVAVVSNPEFLREGSAVHDFLHPDRIVIGADDESTAIKVSGLFLRTSAPLVVTDPATAETIKYAANAFLATKVSFVNAVAALCEAVGADIRQVVLGMGSDHRIGSEFLRPGPGWGGSCFPKDTRALVRIAEDAGYDFSLLKGVIAVNEEQYAAGRSQGGAPGGGFPTGCHGCPVGPDVQGTHRRPAVIAIVRGRFAPPGQRGQGPGVRPHGNWAARSVGRPYGPVRGL